jgi:hemerythrin-like domain-containing protein
MTNHKRTATGSADLLAEHHRGLDQQLDRLVMRAQMGDPSLLRDEWIAFERELSRHLEQEETELLPGFASHDATEARAILAEHAEIRAALLEIGLSLDLHLLRTEAVKDFVRRLRAHAQREEATLYDWARRHLHDDRWQHIKRSLAHLDSRIM